MSAINGKKTPTGKKKLNHPNTRGSLSQNGQNASRFANIFKDTLFAFMLDVVAKGNPFSDTGGDNQCKGNSSFRSFVFVPKVFRSNQQFSKIIFCYFKKNSMYEPSSNKLPRKYPPLDKGSGEAGKIFVYTFYTENENLITPPPR